MAALTEQIAALPGWQRARIDRIRIDAAGVATATWLGMDPIIDPLAIDVDGVSAAGWVKPGPITMHLDADPEAELAALSDSGILGTVAVEQVTAPDGIRWRAQAWTGHDGRSLVVGGSSAMDMLLAADADRRLAVWRLAQAEADVQQRVRDALGVGEPAPRVGLALGVTRGRVYQLRDGRR